jgi:hypothetical protein
LRLLDSGHCPAQKNVVKNVNILARINLLLRPQNEVLSLLLGGIESPLRQQSINSVFSAQKWIQELSTECSRPHFVSAKDFMLSVMPLRLTQRLLMQSHHPGIVSTSLWGR